MTAPLPCPECGSKQMVADGHPKRAVRCLACGRKGPEADTLAEAIGRWNERA